MLFYNEEKYEDCREKLIWWLKNNCSIPDPSIKQNFDILIDRSAP